MNSWRSILSGGLNFLMGSFVCIRDSLACLMSNCTIADATGKISRQHYIKITLARAFMLSFDINIFMFIMFLNDWTCNMLELLMSD